jgi:hypothetical protein
MTEDDAKKKWCPMVRYQLGGIPLNRDACYDRQGTHCIASDCMMWRWASSHAQGPFDVMLAPGETDNGYCGLAGKP